MTDSDIEEMAEPEARIEDVLNEEIRRANRKGSLIPYEREDLPGIPTRRAVTDLCPSCRSDVSLKKSVGHGSAFLWGYRSALLWGRRSIFSLLHRRLREYLRRPVV
jgi:hypothetical protein